MTVRHPFILKALSFSLIFFIGACATLKKERNFSKSGLTVAFRSLNFLDDVQNIKFVYPILLSKENLRNHLLSLYHQDIISPRKPRPLFPRASAAELAPLFKTALKKVKPGEYLHFEYRSSRGLTEGQVFATAKKIHWYFLKINGRAYSNNPLGIRKPTWKLVRMQGQTYQRLQAGGFKKVVKNRIIANTHLPFPKQRAIK